jgi:Uma2 family endonuclease
MPQPALKYYTEREYLSHERASLEKHEYYKGEIFAMGGASFKHNVIQVNVLVQLGSHLIDKKCRPFGSDLRVHIPKNSLYTYPDISIVCDEPKFTDDALDTLINPSVVIEILSPSTANYDRGTKFELYREIPSLREYILIDSTTVHLVHYSKNIDATWTLAETKSADDNFSVSSVGLTIPLSTIYAGVQL